MTVCVHREVAVRPPVVKPRRLSHGDSVRKTRVRPVTAAADRWPDDRRTGPAAPSARRRPRLPRETPSRLRRPKMRPWFSRAPRDPYRRFSTVARPKTFTQIFMTPNFKKKKKNNVRRGPTERYRQCGVSVIAFSLFFAATDVSKKRYDRVCLLIRMWYLMIQVQYTVCGQRRI